MRYDVASSMMEQLWGSLSSPHRMIYAAVTAFGVMIVLCPPTIRLFKYLGIVEYPRKTDSPEIADRHRGKQGTATMGGLVFVVSVLVSVVAWARWDPTVLPVLTAVLLVFGAIGAFDDMIKIRHPSRKGLGKRSKMLLMGIAALLISTILYSFFVARDPRVAVSLQLPLTGWMLPLGPLFMVVVVLVLTGSANAVNLTDGLDGLAPGLLVIAFSAFTVLAFLAGSVEHAAHCNLLFVPGAQEIAVYSAALAGAGLGFLVFNRHPARFFLGDTGALAAGGALGMIAVTIRQEVFLLVVGGVFVAEAVSVILQVWYFRRCGGRIFKCAPLHHHFEFQDWPETRITRSFWIVGAVLSAVTILGTLR